MQQAAAFRISARERKLRPSTTRCVARVALAEGQDVARLGRAEAVDRLVVVADHGHVAVVAGEQLHERGLRLVGVLHLVDHQPAPAAAQVRQPGRVLAQQPHGEREQIVERPGVAALEFFLGRVPDGG